MNALLASAILAGFGLFTAQTPHLLIMAVLVVSGCFRSLQFTSLNAISYAEVEPPKMGQASSLSGMAQQFSLALGVAIGGYGLQIAGDLTGTSYTDAGNFTWAFLLVGLVSAASAWVMFRLPADAGQEMSGRAMPGQEVAEPKAAQRPGT